MQLPDDDVYRWKFHTRFDQTTSGSVPATMDSNGVPLLVVAPVSSMKISDCGAYVRMAAIN